jgi:alpha-amylase
MYLMVDMQVNDLVSTSTDISDSALASYSDGELLFKNESDYHAACSISWGNHQSEQTWSATLALLFRVGKADESQT